MYDISFDLLIINNNWLACSVTAADSPVLMMMKKIFMDLIYVVLGFV